MTSLSLTLALLQVRNAPKSPKDTRWCVAVSPSLPSVALELDDLVTSRLFCAGCLDLASSRHRGELEQPSLTLVPPLFLSTSASPSRRAYHDGASPFLLDAIWWARTLERTVLTLPPPAFEQTPSERELRPLSAAPPVLALIPPPPSYTLYPTPSLLSPSTASSAPRQRRSSLAGQPDCARADPRLVLIGPTSRFRHWATPFRRRPRLVGPPFPSWPRNLRRSRSSELLVRARTARRAVYLAALSSPRNCNDVVPRTLTSYRLARERVRARDCSLRRPDSAFDGEEEEEGDVGRGSGDMRESESPTRALAMTGERCSGA